MKSILAALFLCISLVPALGVEIAELSTAQTVTDVIKAAARIAGTADNGKQTGSGDGKAESPAEIPGEEKGVLDATMEAIGNNLPRAVEIAKSWDGLKDNCSAIKETTVRTLNILVWIAAGVAIMACLVPVLLIVIMVHLRKISRKLDALSEAAKGD